MIGINTNLGSLIVQSNLKKSTNALNTAIERMTTGFKINHAKDNAANYSISTNMSSKISAYQVAEDNINLGLNMLLTASESLDIISSGLSRLHQLAIQANNGTYSDTSLAALKKEAQAIIDEMYVIHNDTNYNGINLLDSSASFLTEVVHRDTSSMTSLSDVDINTQISSGEYSISSADELAKLAIMANNGKISGGEFVLSNSIDLTQNANWTAIGNETSVFAANFDGNGYVIKNMRINTGADYQGLFGNIQGNISNLALEDISVVSGSNSGGLAGSISGNIENCYVTGSVVAESYTGGLVGNMTNGMVGNSYMIGDITGADNVAGLVGHSDSAMESSFFTGNVTGINNVGGLFGACSGQNSYGTVKDSYVRGNIKGSGQSIGGAFGSIYDKKIMDTFFEGIVEGSSRTGGLCGNFGYGNINNSYVDATVKGHSAAGMAGNVWNGYISDSYVILNPDSKVGAVFSYGAQGSGVYNLSNCYYNTTDKSLPLVYQRDELTASFFEKSDRPFTLLSPVPLSVSKTITFQAGIYSSDSSQIALSTKFDITSELYSLKYLSLNNEEYLDILDSAITKVGMKQTEYGSAQNRLMSALDSVSIQYENLISSRSTIRDADIAEESSEYIRNQILQQAAATLLATANQTPSIALQLL